MLASSVNSRIVRRHFSSKWLLLSSHTLSHLLWMAGSVLPGGRCHTSPATTTPLSSPSSSFPLLADARQCAHWRTLPRPLTSQITITSFPASRGCSAVCSMEDTASPSHHPPCFLADVWQCAHRRTLSSSTSTPHTLPILAVSSLEDAVFTFTLLTITLFSCARLVVSSRSSSARQRPSLWDERCSGSLLIPIGKVMAEPLG